MLSERRPWSTGRPAAARCAKARTPRNACLENVTRDVIEVYLTDPGVQPICSTYYVSEELKNAVNTLYLQAASSPSRIALPQAVRSTMDAFLKA